MFEHSAPVERDTRGWCSLPWVCLRRCHSALPSGVSRRAGAWHPHAWGVARLRFSRDHLVFCDGFCTCRNKTMAIYARSFLYPTAAVDSWPCRVPRRRQGPAQSVWNERPAIENQLKICGYKNNVDVVALYLARQGLRSIPSLAQFRRLRYLWINNNKIQDLTFLTKNYYLTELYLNNNELTDISGALKHLCSLQILFLHNNELRKLGKTVKELKEMISLQTLNLFQNPLAYDPDYRLYVIYFLPSVQLLDRKLVTQRERESALHLYNPKRAWVMQSIAFGKRADTSLGTTVGSSRCTQPARRPIIPSGHEFGNSTNKYVIMTATFTVDWNKVATCQERRLKNKAEEPPEKLTVQFR
ncbi:leucine-rich repeat-containing protein 72 [Cyanistes caeruleus]|nr:leucine-rich repeat-containing protein 72 [Cyanistes caeruleus]